MSHTLLPPSSPTAAASIAKTSSIPKPSPSKLTAPSVINKALTAIRRPASTGSADATAAAPSTKTPAAQGLNTSRTGIKAPIAVSSNARPTSVPATATTIRKSAGSILAPVKPAAAATTRTAASTSSQNKATPASLKGSASSLASPSASVTPIENSNETPTDSSTSTPRDSPGSRPSSQASSKSTASSTGTAGSKLPSGRRSALKPPTNIRCPTTTKTSTTSNSSIPPASKTNAAARHIGSGTPSPSGSGLSSPSPSLIQSPVAKSPSIPPLLLPTPTQSKTLPSSSAASPSSAASASAAQASTLTAPQTPQSSRESVAAKSIPPSLGDSTPPQVSIQTLSPRQPQTEETSTQLQPQQQQSQPPQPPPQAQPQLQLLVEQVQQLHQQLQQEKQKRDKQFDIMTTILNETKTSDIELRRQEHEREHAERHKEQGELRISIEQQLQQHKTEWTNLYQQLKEQIAQYQHDQQQYEAALEANRRKEWSALTTQVSSLDEEVGSIRNVLETYNDDIIGLNERGEEMKKQIHQMEAETKSLLTMANESSGRVKKVESDLVDASHSVQLHTQQLKSITNHVNPIAGLLTSLDDKHAAIQHIQQQQQQLIAHLQHRIAELEHKATLTTTSNALSPHTNGSTGSSSPSSMKHVNAEANGHADLSITGNNLADTESESDALPSSSPRKSRSNSLTLDASINQTSTPTPRPSVIHHQSSHSLPASSSFNTASTGNDLTSVFPAVDPERQLGLYASPAKASPSNSALAWTIHVKSNNTQTNTSTLTPIHGGGGSRVSGGSASIPSSSSGRAPSHPQQRHSMSGTASPSHASSSHAQHHTSKSASILSPSSRSAVNTSLAHKHDQDHDVSHSSHTDAEDLDETY